MAFEVQTMLKQIGTGTLFAVSGGRVNPLPGGLGVVLPVAHGYSVEVEYVEGLDLYTVRRMWRRGSLVKVRAEREGVYCDELADVVYRASCYVNVEDSDV